MIKEEVVKASSGIKEMQNAKEISSALAKAVTHHLAGQSENALSDLGIALDSGNRSAEVFAACGYLQLELGRFDEAWENYSKRKSPLIAALLCRILDAPKKPFRISNAPWR
jgi:hypothetical protein